MTKGQIKKKSSTKESNSQRVRQSAVLKGRAPAAIGSRKPSSENPQVRMEGDVTVVKHREFVTDIVSDLYNEFAYDTFEINPANADLFPWLVAIAARFESYRFRKFNVQIDPVCSTATAGKTLVAIDYDCKDTDVVSKSQLMNFSRATDAQVWQQQTNVSLKSDLQRIGPWRFVKKTTADDTDRNASAGILYVATTSVSGVFEQAGGTFSQMAIAELYIDYEVELKTPVLDSIFGSRAPQLKQFEASTIFSTSTARTKVFDTTGAPFIYPSPAHKGAEWVQTTLDQLTDDFGNVVPAGEWVLAITEDLVGKLTLTSPGLLNAAATTNIEVADFTEVAVNQTANPITGTTDRPDMGDNTVVEDLIFFISNAANTLVGNPQTSYTQSFFVKLIAGTYLRWAWNNGVVGRLIGGVNSRLAVHIQNIDLQDGELAAMGPNLSKFWKTQQRVVLYKQPTSFGSAALIGATSATADAPPARPRRVGLQKIYK